MIHVDPRKLEIGKEYIILQRVPVMPTTDPMENRRRQRQNVLLPYRATVKVLEHGETLGAPWYRLECEMKVNGKKKVVRGWINAVGMMGAGVFKATTPEEDAARLEELSEMVRHPKVTRQK